MINDLKGRLLYISTFGVEGEEIYRFKGLVIHKSNLVELHLEDSIEGGEEFERIMHLDNIKVMNIERQSADTDTYDKRIEIKFKQEKDKLGIDGVKEIYPEGKFLNIITGGGRIFIPMKNISYYDLK